MSKKNKKNAKTKPVDEVVIEEELQEQQEPQVIVGLSANMLSNGNITVNVAETIDGKQIDLTLLEDILRRAHTTVYEQKIVHQTLDAFKKSL